MAEPATPTFTPDQMSDVFKRLSAMETALKEKDAQIQTLQEQAASGKKPDTRPEWLKMMVSMNLRYRFAAFGVTWIEDEKTGKIVPSKDPKKAPKFVCEVFDGTTGKFVCSDSGPDESSAREAAFKKAITAEKPLTLAQAATAKVSKSK